MVFQILLMTTFSLFTPIKALFSLSLSLSHYTTYASYVFDSSFSFIHHHKPPPPRHPRPPLALPSPAMMLVKFFFLCAARVFNHFTIPFIPFSPSFFSFL
jgi:hypothetical protein